MKELIFTRVRDKHKEFQARSIDPTEDAPTYNVAYYIEMFRQEQEPYDLTYPQYCNGPSEFLGEPVKAGTLVLMH